VPATGAPNLPNTMQHLRLLSAAAALALAGVIAAQTNEPQTRPDTGSDYGWSIGGGFDYSRGDYGFATDTEMISMPLNVGYETPVWILRLTLPWVNVKGPATVVNGAGTARPTTSSESGIGDAFLSVTRRLGEVGAGVQLDFTGRAKLPTADEARGLGTGEFDYYGQFDVHRTFGSVTPFATLGYRSLGDNAVYVLKDGPYASAGAHFRASDATIVSTAFDWRGKLTDATDDSAEVAVYVTHDLDRRWQVMAYALKGMTNASPDFGGGLQVNYRF
jgi:hypothetical protein